VVHALDVREERERQHAAGEPRGELRGDDPPDTRRFQQVRICAH